MADDTAANSKLVQYLTEAHSKEKELETALAAHIEMAQRPAYKKRLRAHLKETKQHAKLVERRLKKLGGGGLGAKAADLAGKGMAAAKGPLHSMRGTGEEERELKNAKTEYSEEHEEIATYLAIEVLATEVGDTETAKMAKGIRREEERMASFLEKQIPIMTKAVVKAEIPASERKRSAGSRSRSRSGTRAKAGSSTRSKGAGARSGSSRAGARSNSGSKSSSRKRAPARKTSGSRS